MISEADVERALDYLRDNADASAQARANRLHLEDYSSVLKALIMAEHLAEPLGAQTRYAQGDIRYRNHLEALKLAVFEDEKARYLRDAAAAKIEVWRTQQANERGKL